MVKNTAKLFAACVVLGVVNQACALVPADRAHPAAAIDRISERSSAARQVQPRIATSPAARQSTRNLVVAQAATGTAVDAPTAASSALPSTNNPATTNDPAASNTSGASSANQDNATHPRKQEENSHAADGASPSSVTTEHPASTATESTETPVARDPSIDTTSHENADTSHGTNASGDALAPPVPVPDQPVYTDTPKAEPQYDNVWDRIRAGFAMEDLESPRVEAHLAAYLNGAEYFNRIIVRSRRYLHYIVEEVEKRNMPMEIALLPMIESAFNPVAYSRAHASGIWQFIPATGKRYGLQQTFWYDGRNDVTAATRAALDYLQKLHNDFGDWQLALAAYNSGEGTVGRAVRANRSLGRDTSYIHLNLPRETRNYLPKLQAVKNIIADPERYGFTLEEIPNQPYFTKVKANRTMDMRRAAQLADMPLEEFRSLNAGHNRPVITSRDGHTILVPVDKADVFSTNVQSATSSQPLVTWQTYTMKAREDLHQVAVRFGIDVETLKRVNGIGVKKRPRAGHALLVPMVNPAVETNLDAHYATMQSQPAPVDEPPRMMAYRVRSGETLKSIADRHNTTVSQLMRWNKLKVARVSPGQQLKLIPGPAKTSKARTQVRSKVAAKHQKPTAAAHTAKRKQSVARR